eukprot:scaffold323_cov414-Prasinococcus_capsulatus_cf.AAC.25
MGRRRPMEHPAACECNRRSTAPGQLASFDLAGEGWAPQRWETSAGLRCGSSSRARRGGRAICVASDDATGLTRCQDPTVSCPSTCRCPATAGHGN